MRRKALGFSAAFGGSPVQKSFLAFALFLAAVLSACAADRSNPDLETVQRLLARCTLELEAGHYREARDHAQVIIDDSKLASQDSRWVDQARLCYVVSNSLSALSEFSRFLSSLFQTVGPSPGTSKFVNSGRAVHPSVICLTSFRSISDACGQPYLDPLGIPRNALQENIDQLEIIRSHSRLFSWHIGRLPVKVGAAELFDAGKAYDLGEVNMLYGFSRILLGGFDLMQSQNYTIAARPLADYVLDVEGNPVRNFQVSPGKAMANLYAIVLATSPAFLTLDKSIGADIMKDSREHYPQGCEGL